MKTPNAPPRSVEAEMAVLGAMLLGNMDAVDEGLSLLTVGDFYQPVNGQVFEAMGRVRHRNEAVDVITVQEEMGKGGGLDTVGIEYLMQLTDVEFTTSNLAYYAEIVREKAMLRRMIEAAQQITAQAMNGPDNVQAFASDSLAAMLKATAGGETKKSLTLAQSLRVVVGDLIDQWQAGGGAPGLPSGFPSLDAITGGYKRGDLVIMAGRPGIGKTALCTSVLLSAAKRKSRVLFYSLEMGHQQITLRMLSSECKIDSRRLEEGNLSDDEQQRMMDAANRLYLDNLIVDDSGGLTSAEIIRRARREATQGQLDLVIVDYLQEIATSGKREDTRALEVAENARAFKALAKELNCTVILLSQLNRAIERREDKRPMMSDLYESGGIEAAADLVMGLYRASYYQSPKPVFDEGVPDEIELSILKHRKGGLGTVTLNYFLHWTRFEEIDNRHTGF